MRHLIFGARLAAPLALLVLVAGTARAQSARATPEGPRTQQRAQSPADAPGKEGAANPTRELEAEIEEYPGANDTATDSAEAVIPEAIAPAPLVRPAPKVRAVAPAGSSIDAREVQRVFGQDTSVLDLTTLDAKQVTRLQQRLREMGHYLDKLDGIVGPKTTAALQAMIADQYALSQRLLRQGQMTTELAGQVGLAEPNQVPAPAQPPAPNQDPAQSRPNPAPTP